jgi:hypothetical protein
MESLKIHDPNHQPDMYMYQSTPRDLDISHCAALRLQLIDPPICLMHFLREPKHCPFDKN